MVELETDENEEISCIIGEEEKQKMEKSRKRGLDDFESIVREVKPKRTNFDVFDGRISGKIDTYDEAVRNLHKIIKENLSKIEKIEGTAGYKDLLVKIQPIKDVMLALREVINNQATQIHYLNLCIEFLSREKSIALNLMKDVKDSEIEIQLIDKLKEFYTSNIKENEKIHQDQMKNLQESFTLQIKTVHESYGQQIQHLQNQINKFYGMPETSPAVFQNRANIKKEQPQLHTAAEDVRESQKKEELI